MQFSTKTPTYFRPTSNVGFHKLFCTEGNDELVLQLLNAVIDDHRIVSFKRLDTVHQINADTSAIFDKVYFIGLLNYVHWHGRPQPITKVALYTEDDHLLAQKNYLQIFVELPKLQAETDGDDFGRIFLRALRDIGKSDERPEEYSHKDLDLLFRTSDYNNLNNEEKKSYDKNMTTVEDLMDYARECGERAKAESRLEIAKNLLSAGIDKKTIASCTGLTEAEIKAL